MSEAMRPFDLDVSGQGVLSGVRRLARWFGVTMPFGAEHMFLMEDGVPIALYPQATPRPTLALLAGVVRALRSLFAVDPSQWEEQEYPTLLRQITLLEQAAQQAGDLSEATVLQQMDRAVAHASDAFFSRRSYMPTVMLPVLLRRQVRKRFPAPSDGLYADLMSAIPHTTARLNRALDHLAAEAADDPAVRAALHTADPAARLKGTPFLARFDAFLAEFGSREVAQVGASWSEEPHVVWSALRSLLGRRTLPAT
ncbi:MAG: pyruvate phosphate dikinase PEP/pyruvate-binding protein, partial [Firmicutes bacterium]|nr:pyruvate phosphate dikinase PEP/pyruvate-binding protein [Bacillota bacterium]